MQTLLDTASPLPGILEKFDLLCKNQIAVDYAVVQEIYAALEIVQGELRNWEDQLISGHESPLWWPVSSTVSESRGEAEKERVFPISYHFPNILIANTMTHYWAFLAITQSTLSRLEKLPNLRLSYSTLNCPSNHDSDSAKTPVDLIELASNICASMAYLMHPSQKLYGPASTFFPVWIALQIFQRGTSPESRKKELWCLDLLKELEERGLPLAGYLVGCPGI